MLSYWRQFAALTAGLIIAGSAPGSLASASDLPQSAGALIGVVADAGGLGQLGATVLLYNRLEKLVKKTVTNEKGQFGFDDLVPDSYIVRVSLSSFVPAVRQGILVQPGMRSFLNINLASVLSSVEFVYATPHAPRLLSDDWRWVLRSSMSTRPVLRFLPTTTKAENIFSNTRGMVKVSAGDGASAFQGSQPDLGTAFAVATSLYGVNNVQVSGNVGYSSRGGIPAASFRTRYSRDTISNGLAVSNSPEVQLTVRQTFLPRAGMAINGANAPSLGTMTGLVMDRTKLGDNVEFTYGAQLESVTYFDRLNLISPFARMDAGVTKADTVRVAWSSGAAPDEAYTAAPATGPGDLQQDLSTLSAFPRVSMRNGHAHVQRMNQAEVSVTHDIDSDTHVSVAAYYEQVANAALAAIGDTADYSTGEMLPDLFTRSSIFNIGSYSRRGIMASLDRKFGDHWSAQVAFGNGGTLQPRDRLITPGDADSLRGALRRTQRSWTNVRLAGVVPGAGTRFAASYMFTDYRAALPAHRYLTLRQSPDVGLNMQIRQPIPSFGMWTGRVEAIAELRNILQQGYLPLQGGAGRRVVLLPSPRTVRGGLAFIF
ncbi:MAG TPA: carboxypeptidase-like regulatory domain-containing protein [Bryobacteraceae bacterium]|nr:carboxypeptidase-like regulatory domain-containing protein [Bryobacteraceae bacterium]